MGRFMPNNLGGSCLAPMAPNLHSTEYHSPQHRMDRRAKSFTHHQHDPPENDCTNDEFLFAAQAWNSVAAQVIVTENKPFDVNTSFRRQRSRSCNAPRRQDCYNTVDDGRGYENDASSKYSSATAISAEMTHLHAAPNPNFNSIPHQGHVPQHQYNQQRRRRSMSPPPSPLVKSKSASNLMPARNIPAPPLVGQEPPESECYERWCQNQDPLEPPASQHPHAGQEPNGRQSRHRSHSPPPSPMRKAKSLSSFLASRRLSPTEICEATTAAAAPVSEKESPQPTSLRARAEQFIRKSLHQDEETTRGRQIRARSKSRSKSQSKRRSRKSEGEVGSVGVNDIGDINSAQSLMRSRSKSRSKSRGRHVARHSSGENSCLNTELQQQQQRDDQIGQSCQGVNSETSPQPLDPPQSRSRSKSKSRSKSRSKSKGRSKSRSKSQSRSKSRQSVRRNSRKSLNPNDEQGGHDGNNDGAVKRDPNRSSTPGRSQSRCRRREVLGFLEKINSRLQHDDFERTEQVNSEKNYALECKPDADSISKNGDQSEEIIIEAAKPIADAGATALDTPKKSSTLDDRIPETMSTDSEHTPSKQEQGPTDGLKTPQPIFSSPSENTPAKPPLSKSTSFGAFSPTCVIHTEVRLRKNRCPLCAAEEMKRMRSKGSGHLGQMGKSFRSPGARANIVGKNLSKSFTSGVNTNGGVEVNEGVKRSASDGGNKPVVGVKRSSSNGEEAAKKCDSNAVSLSASEYCQDQNEVSDEKSLCSASSSSSSGAQDYHLRHESSQPQHQGSHAQAASSSSPFKPSLATLSELQQTILLATQSIGKFVPNEDADEDSEDDQDSGDEASVSSMARTTAPTKVMGYNHHASRFAESKGWLFPVKQPSVPSPLEVVMVSDKSSRSSSSSLSGCSMSSGGSNISFGVTPSTSYDEIGCERIEETAKHVNRVDHETDSEQGCGQVSSDFQIIPESKGPLFSEDNVEGISTLASPSTESKVMEGSPDLDINSSSSSTVPKSDNHMLEETHVSPCSVMAEAVMMQTTLETNQNQENEPPLHSQHNDASRSGSLQSGDIPTATQAGLGSQEWWFNWANRPSSTSNCQSKMNARQQKHDPSQHNLNDSPETTSHSQESSTHEASVENANANEEIGEQDRKVPSRRPSQPSFINALVQNSKSRSRSKSKGRARSKGRSKSRGRKSNKSNASEEEVSAEKSSAENGNANTSSDSHHDCLQANNPENEQPVVSTKQENPKEPVTNNEENVEEQVDDLQIASTGNEDHFVSHHKTFYVEDPPVIKTSNVLNSKPTAKVNAPDVLVDEGPVEVDSLNIGLPVDGTQEIEASDLDQQEKPKQPVSPVTKDKQVITEKIEKPEGLKKSKGQDSKHKQSLKIPTAKKSPSDAVPLKNSKANPTSIPNRHMRGPITHPRYKLGDVGREEDMIIFPTSKSKSRRRSRRKKNRKTGSTASVSSDSSSSSDESDSDDEEIRHRNRHMKDSFVFLAVCHLNHLDAAFVRRSDGSWTYALVADRSEKGIRFVVNSKGATKMFPTSLFQSSIRRIRVLTHRNGDAPLLIKDGAGRKKRFIGRGRSKSGRGKGRLVSPSPTRRCSNVLNLPPTIMEDEMYVDLPYVRVSLNKSVW